VETQKKRLNMPKTSVVILNWNGMKHLQMFLETVVRFSSGKDSEVCVADNGSTDGSDKWVEENFQNVRLIKLDRNHGFAGGYNLALEQVDSDYYILLNSDIEVTEGWIVPLVRYMDSNPDSAACQPKILSWHNREYFEHAGAAGGFLDKYGFPFCRGRILDRVEKDEGQYNSQADIFWTSGACMIVRADAWKQCGGFDPAFFAHMEEIDLCWRFSRSGYRTGFIAESVVYHVGGGSLSYESPYKIYLNFRNSLFMLYKNLPDKNFSRLLFIRKVMDGLAAVQFLVSGKFRYFGAVFRAHMSYYGRGNELRQQRSRYPVHDAGRAASLILNKSVIFEFYVRRHKTYSSLINKQ
jgi:GT2 family glycosyltransferase